MALFYLKLFKETPERLLRSEGAAVAVWYQDEWRPTVLSILELDGLGGSSDYRRIKSQDVAKWKAALNGPEKEPEA